MKISRIRQASAQSEPGNLGLESFLDRLDLRYLGLEKFGLQAMHCALASYALCNCAVLVLNSLHVYKEVGGCRSAL